MSEIPRGFAKEKFTTARRALHSPVQKGPRYSQAGTDAAKMWWWRARAVAAFSRFVRADAGARNRLPCHGNCGNHPADSPRPDSADGQGAPKANGRVAPAVRMMPADG